MMGEEGLSSLACSFSAASVGEGKVRNVYGTSRDASISGHLLPPCFHRPSSFLVGKTYSQSHRHPRPVSSLFCGAMNSSMVCDSQTEFSSLPTSSYINTSCCEFFLILSQSNSELCSIILSGGSGCDRGCSGCARGGGRVLLIIL